MSRGLADAKAQGMKKKVAQELFIKISYGMLDWLQPIMKLSLLFQRKDLDISIVKVNNTLKYIFYSILFLLCLIKKGKVPSIFLIH